MTPVEFKAWFDGFTEALSGTPSKDQWARIKSRVAEIDGRPTTKEIFVDRYFNWPGYYPPYRAGWASYAQNCVATNSLMSASSNSLAGTQLNCEYDAKQAMLSLGRADASRLS